MQELLKEQDRIRTRFNIVCEKLDYNQEKFNENKEMVEENQRLLQIILSKLD